MGNREHSTRIAERRSGIGARTLGRWALKVAGSLLMVLLSFLLLAPGGLRAQMPPQIPPGAQALLQVAQPAVDVSSPVTATAAFDPPVVRAGETTFYRVNVDATEASIPWPEALSAPAELKFGAPARGQLTQMLGDRFRPLTAFVYEVQATAAGRYTITNFSVTISG